MQLRCIGQLHTNFNPRSLTGATKPERDRVVNDFHFNPRSLTGATDKREWTLAAKKFQSTLPHGSDRLPA